MDEPVENSKERKFKKAVMARLARMESRLVEGFSQLGANVKERPDSRIQVDKQNQLILLPHMGFL